MPHAPIMAIGFRPFFLLAALLAAAWLPLYVVVLAGGLGLDSPFGAVGWHAHEMVFGYTGAVLCGFLFTATQNWTSRTTVVGWPLVAVVALWAAGRVAVLYGGSWPPALVASLDVSLLPLAALIIARPIWAARSRRNYGFPLLLLVLGGANLASHLALSQVIEPSWGFVAQRVAVDAVVVVLVLFGGRIVPLFTRNAIKPTHVREPNLLDRLGLWSVVAYLALDGHPATSTAGGLAALAAGALNLARLWGWRTPHTLRDPLLLVLHVGWAFVGAGLVLTGISRLAGPVPTSVATHALTAGGIGVLTFAMLARVSLGHTGRPLKAHKATSIAFALIVSAALIRVVVPWVAPAAYEGALHASATAWSLAFVLFLVVYTPILLTARADGRPG